LRSERLSSLAQIIFTPIAIHLFMPIIAHYLSLAFSLSKTSARFVRYSPLSTPYLFSVLRTHVARSLPTVTLRYIRS